MLFGFGVFLIGTGLFYGLPMPVQPMKAVSAVILTDGLRPWRGRRRRADARRRLAGARRDRLRSGVWLGMIPQSVSAGLQLGLGLLLGVLGINYVCNAADRFRCAGSPLCAVATPILPGRSNHAGAAAIAGWLSNNSVAPHEIAFAWSAPRLVVPTWPEVWHSLEIAGPLQLSLTLTNAIIVTASLSREIFSAAGQIASERNLALSSGLANVLLSPFGAMPMCHGAGGLQAQYRFGARTGLAPIMFGSVLVVLAVGFADNAAALFSIIPIGAVGALRHHGRNRPCNFAPAVRCAPF